MTTALTIRPGSSVSGITVRVQRGVHDRAIEVLGDATLSEVVVEVVGGGDARLDGIVVVGDGDVTIRRCTLGSADAPIDVGVRSFVRGAITVEDTMVDARIHGVQWHSPPESPMAHASLTLSGGAIRLHPGPSDVVPHHRHHVYLADGCGLDLDDVSLSEAVGAAAGPCLCSTADGVGVVTDTDPDGWDLDGLIATVTHGPRTPRWCDTQAKDCEIAAGIGWLVDGPLAVDGGTVAAHQAFADCAGGAGRLDADGVEVRRRAGGSLVVATREYGAPAGEWRLADLALPDGVDQLLAVYASVASVTIHDVDVGACSPSGGSLVYSTAPIGLRLQYLRGSLAGRLLEVAPGSSVRLDGDVPTTTLAERVDGSLVVRIGAESGLPVVWP